MVHLIGDAWWKAAVTAALPPAPAGAPVHVIEDSLLTAPGSPGSGWPPALRRVLTDRGYLREAIQRAGLAVPAWVRARTFEETSRWAVARNRFPLAIKSAANGAAGRGVFRLEGFRELSAFFDRVKALEPDADVLLEEWVRDETTIEVTVAPEHPPLVARKGLERSLAAIPAWRLFPIPLSGRHAKTIEILLDALARLTQEPLPLLRLTVALGESGGTLLALSGSANRLEYFPGWAEAAGLTPLLSTPPSERPAQKAGTDHVAGPPNPRLARLQLLRRSPKQPPFPCRPPATEDFRVERYVAADRQAAALLTGRDPIALSRQARLLARLLEETADG